MMRFAFRAFGCARGSLIPPCKRAAPFATTIRHTYLSAVRHAAGAVQLRKQWIMKGNSWQWRSLASQATPEKAASEDADAVGDFDEDQDEDLDDWDEFFEEDVGLEISTENLDWGEKSLTISRQILSEKEEFKDIELYSLRAISSGSRLDIRLDKMTDKYGSPSLVELEDFSRVFTAQMEVLLGEAEVGNIQIEISSPGIERAVRIPEDLNRFAGLPMKVEFHCGEDSEKVDTKVLEAVSYDANTGIIRWKLANVRVNRAGSKGRGLSKKQREQVFEISLAALRKANLHMDF